MVRRMKNEMGNEREHEMEWNYVRVMWVCSYDNTFYMVLKYTKDTQGCLHLKP